MKGRVILSNPPPDTSDANAESQTATRPFKSFAFGSLRGEAKASSGRMTTPQFCIMKHMGDDAPIGLAGLAFDDSGLVPVVVQDHLTGEVRMVAYANVEAVRATLETGRATFFSRSRPWPG